MNALAPSGLISAYDGRGLFVLIALCWRQQIGNEAHAGRKILNSAPGLDEFGVSPARPRSGQESRRVSRRISGVAALDLDGHFQLISDTAAVSACVRQVSIRPGFNSCCFNSRLTK